MRDGINLVCDGFIPVDATTFTENGELCCNINAVKVNVHIGFGSNNRMSIVVDDSKTFIIDRTIAKALLEEIANDIR